MFLKKENKIISYFVFYIFFIFIFFTNIPNALAVSLDFSHDFIKYAKGEEVRIEVVVNSEVSINAISADIVFTNNILYLSSIERDSSVIDLWVKEPIYSNGIGSINFEGVILDGHIGESRNVITLVFSAKKAGNAILQFSKASVLANDGTGKDLLTSKGVINLKIDNLGKVLYKKNELELYFWDKIILLIKKLINKSHQIEESKNLPMNSILITAVFLFVVIFYLLRWIYIRLKN